MGLPITIGPLIAENWDWIKLRARPVLCEDTDGIVAYRGGELVAAAVFDQWSANSCQVHMVIEDPFVIRHDFLYWAFHFPFVTRQKGLIVGFIPSDNHEALRLSKHLGFRETYRVPEADNLGVDFVLHEMRRFECRWLNYKLRRAA